MPNDEFSRRFGGSSSSSNNKPECYGDEDYFDRDDPTCRGCGSRGTCEVVIRRKSKVSRPSSSHGLRAKKKKRDEDTGRVFRPDRDSYVEVEADETDTFTGVLFHNAGLNSLQGFTSTLDDAVANIPRKGYRNVFSRLRGKKK